MEILKFKPCNEAVEFRARYTTFKEAWDNCPRGDWMLWIAKRVGVDIKTLTKAKALCALTVRHLMKDQRSINACEVALKFADGLATKYELYAAADAADDAYAAYTYAAAYAAYAAADDDAADAAADAADAAADAAYAAAAAAAAYAADAADADAARKGNQKKTADICRDILTDIVIEKINELK